MTITPHQLELLAVKGAMGLTDKEVARRFGIKRQSVKNQFWRIRKSIGARTNAHAMLLLWPVIEPLVGEGAQS